MDNEDAPEKKFIPPAPEGDKDGGEQPGKKEENGNQTEVIEEVLELFDQLTPLIEKLRSK